MFVLLVSKKRKKKRNQMLISPQKCYYYPWLRWTSKSVDENQEEILQPDLNREPDCKRKNMCLVKGPVKSQSFFLSPHPFVILHLTQWFSKQHPRTAASRGNLLDINHLRPTESEILGAGPRLYLAPVGDTEAHPSFNHWFKKTLSRMNLNRTHIKYLYEIPAFDGICNADLSSFALSPFVRYVIIY